MNKLSKSTDVDRCVRCNHFGEIDDSGICQVWVYYGNTDDPNDTDKRCECKCVFPSTSVSEVEDKTSASAGKTSLPQLEGVLAAETDGLRIACSRLIKLAAKAVTAHGFISPFADDNRKGTPLYILNAAEKQREVLRQWGIEMREIADSLSHTRASDASKEYVRGLERGAEIADRYTLGEKPQLITLVAQHNTATSIAENIRALIEAEK